MADGVVFEALAVGRVGGVGEAVEIVVLVAPALAGVGARDLAELVGIPKEARAGEHRVALMPSGVKSLVHPGNRVLVETGAGAA